MTERKVYPRITTDFCRVELIEDSISPTGIRICTMQLRYWRAIHAEFMTHRVFSRNASSSRAIPVQKILEQVWNDPAGPMHWGSNKPGMQAGEQVKGWRLKAAKTLWKYAGRVACGFSWSLMKMGLHKQVANRLLEPWQYINVVVTSTEWDNFFALRDHKDAQPEFQHLAHNIRNLYNQSVPQKLNYGEWHLPYVTDEERQQWRDHEILRRMSAARCARTSYLTHEMKTPSVKSDVDLYRRLVGSMPIHASPVEHQATPIERDKACNLPGITLARNPQDPHAALVPWSGNFREWFQFRKTVEANFI